MNIAKSYSKLNAIAAMELGLAMILAMVAFTYVSGVSVNLINITVIALVTYGGIVVFERGHVDYKQSHKIANEQTYNDDRDGALADVARIGIKVKKVTAIPFILTNIPIMIAILAILIYIFSQIAGEITGINTGILVPLIVIAIHIALIRPIFLHRMSSGGLSKMENKLSQIKTVPEGLEIQLLTGNERNQHKLPKPVIVKFSEISSLTVQNTQQVQAIKDFEIGQDVDMAARHAKDMYLFMRKKIARPSVFYMPIDNPFITHIVLQGKELLYIAAVPKIQAESAVAAWEHST